MATWGPLQQRLAEVDERLTLSWAELDALVGGLPQSAYDYRAFWGGDRSAWRGFRTTDVRVGHEVTFVRQAGDTPRSSKATSPVRVPDAGADLILVGCVKSKLDHSAPAKDLYTSALFRKERAYAESTGKPWFILSAKHGLVAPDEAIEPYDVHLKRMPAAYRAEWALKVLRQIAQAFGPVDGLCVEIHAGGEYVDHVMPRLKVAGARVVAPLEGLSLGERLAWYRRNVRRLPGVEPGDAPAPVGSLPRDAAQMVEQLGRGDSALSPRDFLATAGMGLRHPGMYSWWADAAGAATLSAGLGHRVDPGLIYAGLAGATRSRSGKASGNTLWGRINGMHLGGRHDFSTFRRTLGSILAHELQWSTIDESALTAWMFEHLKVVAVPVADADTLDDLETRVLAELDPPLNLMKMPKTPLRRRLSELRRQYGAGRRS